MEIPREHLMHKTNEMISMRYIFLSAVENSRYSEKIIKNSPFLIVQLILNKSTTQY